MTLLNLAERLSQRGMTRTTETSAIEMEFPLRQHHVADATGLTPVHVKQSTIRISAPTISTAASDVHQIPGACSAYALNEQADAEAEQLHRISAPHAYEVISAAIAFGLHPPRGPYIARLVLETLCVRLSRMRPQHAQLANVARLSSARRSIVPVATTLFQILSAHCKMRRSMPLARRRRYVRPRRDSSAAAPAG